MSRAFVDVAPPEAEQLVRDGAVCVLDVRTPQEYAGLGHIPGSLLLPVDLIASAPATLPADGKPILVCCEHGMRSAHAAAFLARAGFRDVRNLAGGMAAWAGPRDFTEGAVTSVGPASWLVENADLIPRGGDALDVACGRGRHALLLAAAGMRVRAVDRDPERIRRLQAIASGLGLPVEAGIVDLESGKPRLGEGDRDLVVCFHYLHRPLFPALVAAVKPGGVLLYETFTTAQAERGHPTNPDYLLQPGELLERVFPLEVLRHREGEHEGRMVSAVAARRES